MSELKSKSQLDIAKRDIQQLYNLPTEVRYCRNCVISNQRPRIRFDEEGVCSACRFAQKKSSAIDWESRERELFTLCDRFRGTGGQFDVVVPCSGGKDSAFVAHELKFKYKMNPLTVTWSPHIFTEIGFQNLQNFIRAGHNNILGTPNGKVHAEMTRLAFIHMGDPFQPFIYGVKAFPLTIATRFKIPLIMYAENGEVEYGGDSKNEASRTHDLNEDLKRHYYSGFEPQYWTKFGIPERELDYYSPPPLDDMRQVGVECHFFGYYRKWIPQENYYYAAKHTGFQPNPDGRSEGTYSKYASIDDKIDGFHYWMAFIKFGIGRCTSDAAHEIRDGHITREEAVALVRKFDGEFPNKYFKDFLEYTRLTENDFWAVADSYRSPHLWAKDGGKWKLKFQVT